MLSDFQCFLLGAGLNLAVALLVVRFIYYRVTRNKSFVLSFLAFSTVIYFVLQFLNSVELSLGFGFGLFAIFSILRYRTDEVPIREMTYLFTVIGLAVMNSFLSSTEDLVRLLIGNGAVVVLLYMLEKEWGFRFESSLRLTYEMIDLIAPAKRELLLADLRKRTGLPVKRAEVRRIDFLRDTADVMIYYDKSSATDRTIRETEPQELSSQQDGTAWKPFGFIKQKAGPGHATVASVASRPGGANASDRSVRGCPREST